MTMARVMRAAGAPEHASAHTRNTDPMQTVPSQQTRGRRCGFASALEPLSYGKMGGRQQLLRAYYKLVRPIVSAAASSEALSRAHEYSIYERPAVLWL